MVQAASLSQYNATEGATRPISGADAECSAGQCSAIGALPSPEPMDSLMAHCTYLERHGGSVQSITDLQVRLRSEVDQNTTALTAPASSSAHHSGIICDDGRYQDVRLTVEHGSSSARMSG